MKDYLEWFSHRGTAKYVSSTIIRGRRIALYGIDVCITADGDKVELSPVIPAITHLLALASDNPEKPRYQWTGTIWEIMDETIKV